jgi:predicted transglutaminase-like cysteine proteinase
MKTLRNIIIGSTVAAALVLITSAQADVKTKGGASELMKKAEPVSAPASTVMACPKCKSEFTVRTDNFARGSTKPTTIVENHFCSKCATALTTVGTGKQAKQLALHTCATCR